MPFLIRKASGELEQFDKEKLKRSLTIPGASDELADEIVQKVEENLDAFKSTEDIYRYALDQLKEEHPHIATKYNIKKALLEFGPTGFPFEKYAARIFDALGYKTELNHIISGWCVDHEVDIVVTKDKKTAMVECKFHNIQGLRTDVQVTMYTEARSEDIAKTWKPADTDAEVSNLWLVTNTRFTYEAIKYGNCKNQNLLSWDYPKGNSLADLISRFQIYPITASVSLKHRQKAILLENGFVLCSDVMKNLQAVRDLKLHLDIDILRRECAGKS